MKLSNRIFECFCVTALLLSISCAAAGQNDTYGWQGSSEKYNTDLIKELKGEIARDKYKQINGIVVIKNGKLLIEEYFNGESRDTLHDPRSVGKTFGSALLGIALHDGHIKNLEQKLSDFYDLKEYKNFSEKKEQVTLRHLLTMSSAFEGDDDVANSPGNEENMYPQQDWVRWILDLPMSQTRASGDEWHYFTAGVVLIGDILNKRVPGGLDDYADKKLFKPLGISSYRWVRTPQNLPSTGGGLRLTALDLAKFGQLYKNGGKWDGRQIIPEPWVKDSFRKYSTTRFAGESYGYLWWNKTYNVGTRSYETYFCSGNGGNKIFVFTDQPLVIVVTASAYFKPFAHRQVDEMMTKFILPAVAE